MGKMSRSFKRHIKNSENRKNKMEKFSSDYSYNVENFTQCCGDLTVDVEIKKIESGSDSGYSEVDFFLK